MKERENGDAIEKSKFQRDYNRQENLVFCD